MGRKDSGEGQPKKTPLRATEFSRRQVLKSLGIAAVGTAIAYLPIACKSNAGSTSDTTGVDPDTGPSPVVSTTIIDSLTPVASSSDNPPSTYVQYVPSTAKPSLITIPGTTCTVATDRQYSADNIWIKPLPNNFVVMGITVTLYHILYNPYSCSVSPIGSKLAKQQSFGVIEGYKMTTDLLSPVSGTLTDFNNLVVGNAGGQGAGDGMLTALTDVYGGGWMVVVQLSDPAELSTLLTAQQYATLVTNME
jgi:glycine cleavage system H protein